MPAIRASSRRSRSTIASGVPAARGGCDVLGVGGQDGRRCRRPGASAIACECRVLDGAGRERQLVGRPRGRGRRPRRRPSRRRSWSRTVRSSVSRRLSGGLRTAAVRPGDRPRRRPARARPHAPAHDLEAHDLPGRQVRGLAVLVPQPQASEAASTRVSACVPVGDLGPVGVEADGAEERALLGQPLQAPRTISGSIGCARHRDGDVPQADRRRRSLRPSSVRSGPSLALPPPAVWRTAEVR